MKILITGASGQLGKSILKCLRSGCSSLGNIDSNYKDAHIVTPSSKELDVTNYASVMKYIEELSPQFIINLAAYTLVDNCEKENMKAFAVNSLGARNLAIAAEKVNAKIIYISTDYVFSGEGEKPYTEMDLPCPQNIYGKSKLLGEKYVMNFSSRYFIVRTSWLYSNYGKNFVSTIIDIAKDRGKLEVVKDQLGSPTSCDELVYHILKILNTEEYGIYHCTGRGQCSWYDFATSILDFAHISCKITPITSDKIKRLAKRPTFSVLHSVMLPCTIGNHMTHWQEALFNFMKNFK
ncbi:dTDP-4-dehydrorhamnose reductase [Clostridium tetanomorphum]|uniref:dTDP-4-dehydrorhamnose reductase n=1 Tax=Clostridium tetanomorphum TaxID=1553 RepID=A0A923IYZ1_CLOTT|nr:dTDP-4-dehydrorhamnose reductase [Clostridium tetanomorphum]KAJ51376.1 dTDP-4-dehydrorhamnose reductase [Clostridium tetanomorphum DSM 665]MBC2396417.1 dTDP-4-dehydrorhamnose reductase [Clostridium tetanomorphum]MBP1863353.1 dTDP-4-dehydrorhamnose reductase [Clostridium tetanomorphum]NRS83450.1 dTDP-4-dehydrorhamnose reductase [Clostridium tetanomorphum]NRZ96650.1 dTDP-4-dehydrorhamnose reductase [Clostridium tetanomorphum]